VPRKVFVAGEILTASDVNVNLMDQAVQRFADSTARGSAIPSPTEGMTSYLDDLNRIEVYNGSAWGAVGGILQVVSTTKTDTFTTTSTSYADVTGLSLSITPSAASSKIFVIVSLAYALSSPAANYNVRAQIVRDSTAIGGGTSSGNRPSASFGLQNSTQGIHYVPSSHNVLDSPNTTSAITYKVQAAAESGATFLLNRTVGDSDQTYIPRFASTITAIEVAG
jgi:hypothetical protein